jgi:predicted dehydrogenase
MPQTIQWGILGAGRIARKFASDLRLVNGARLVAVGSRGAGTADEFANEFNIPHRHHSYEALVQNPEVDIIYIATPHTLHHENTLLCLKHKKAVLCEKPFAMNGRQVTEMIKTARHENVFLMEALWTKFLPQFIKVQQLIKDGMVGGITSIRADFGFTPTPPVPARLFDPVLGGGSLMDIGIYPVFLALSILGRPDEIQATMTPAPTGVDEQCSIVFKYNSGAIAQLFSTNAGNTAVEADITGREGRIRMTNRFHNLTGQIEYTPGKADEKQLIEVEKDVEGFGYQYEARHAGDCIREGLKESPVMTHNDSIDLIETLDGIRKIAGIHYRWDNE